VIDLKHLWPDPDRRDDALIRCLEDVYRSQARSTIELSPQEKRCIECASYGLDAYESADLLGVGYESVKTHLKHTRRKLRAKNTMHAVAEALRQGLIR
jgi:LuxR family quorum sensing-dependent transcriptional regulator